jgi:xanthosine utilization system XapX-like protein
VTWLWCYLSFNAGLLVGIVWQVIKTDIEDRNNG